MVLIQGGGAGLPGKKKPDTTDTSPADADVVTWDDASELAIWAPAPGAVGGEANTASNSGTGEGLALTKVLVDLPFKSLKATAPITISSDATSVTYAAQTASATAQGVVELATIAEVNTGTDTTRAITPAGLAGSTLASDVTTNNSKISYTDAAKVAGIEAGADVTDDANVSATASVTANTAKVTNATHTGDVTGSGALTIADNVVTLAKMAHGTDGNLISYDATGAPAAVATGTSGQVLTSNGAGAAPTFQAGGAGGGGFYVELDRTTLGSSGDNIEVAAFAARENLRLIIHLIPTGGVILSNITFNNDTGNNYARRFSADGSAEQTSVSAASIGFTTSASEEMFITIDIINKSANIKLFHLMTDETGGAAASVAPSRRVLSGKWVNTSAQITTIDITNTGAGSYATGSEVIVLGSD